LPADSAVSSQSIARTGLFQERSERYPRLHAYVDPTRYRQGIGRQLLRHAINASAGSLSTEVLVGNDTALALYLSEGFKIERRVDGKLTGNEAFSAAGYVLQRTPSEAR
jgi:ribosomal protein S18 acetylase RimI-like enzyme